MKLNKLILICFVFCLAVETQGQIEQEIKSYVDSTEQLINNGRKLLLEEVHLYNYTKVHEIYTYLKRRATEKQCDAFTYNEHLLIALLTSDWNSFTQKAEDFKDYTVPLCTPSSPNMQKQLYLELNKNMALLEKNIETAEINSEDKALLHLFEYVLRKEKEEKQYAVELKQFKKNYPASSYNEFVKSYLPSPSVPMSMAFSIGPTAGFPAGNLADLYTNGIGFGMDVDFCINNVYLSFFINTAMLKLTRPFYAEDNRGNTHSFRSNDKFNYFQGGLKSGYYLFRNRRLHLSPYLAIGGASITSDIYENAADNNKEVKMVESFFAGPGIHTEVKLYQYKGGTPSPYYYSYSPPGYISLKLDAGYNFITSKKIPELTGNMLYASLSLVWGIGLF